MRIFINNVLVQAQMQPSFTATLDETMDNGILILNNVESATPYAPMQEVKFEIDNNNTELFYIMSDKVSLFSNTPLRYTHTITLVQNIRKLSKHLLRNTVFSQPAQSELVLHTSILRPLMNVVDGGVDKFTFGVPVIEQNGVVSKFAWQNEAEVLDKMKVSKITTKSRSYLFSNVSTFNSDKKVKGQKIAIPYATKYQITNGDNLVKFSSTYLSGNLPIDQEQEVSVDLATFTPDIYKVKLDLANDSSFDLTDLGFPTNANIDDLRYALLLENDTTFHVYYYTMFDVLDTLNKQYKQKRYAFSGNGIVLERDNLYNMPSETSEFGLLLKNTIAPNFSFTQTTYYEALAECFKVFDGIMTIDENNVLGIEYYNETKTKLNNLNAVGMSLSVAEEKFNNTLITQYQNAKVRETYPANNNYVYAVANKFGINADANYVIRTPHKIDYINSFKVKLDANVEIPCQAMKSQSASTEPDIIYFDNVSDKNEFLELDCTDRVLSSDIYNLLPYKATYGNTSPYELYQTQCLYFTQGTNEIVIDESYKEQSIEIYFYKNVLYNSYLKKTGALNNFCPPNDIQLSSEVERVSGFEIPTKYDLKFKLDYYTQVDGRLAIERKINKYNGSMLSSQSNAGVDLGKLGENMEGLINKIGENTLSLNIELKSDYSNCIKKGDYYIDENGSKWVANVCTYKFINNYIEESVQFVKNFNMLSQMVRIPQQKRFSEISSALTNKAEDNIVEYIYYTAYNFGTSEASYMSISQDLFASAIIKGFNKNTYQNSTTQTTHALTSVDYATVHTQYTSPIQFKTIFNSYYGNEKGSIEIYIPLIKYASGENLCFEMSFDSPINAGTQSQQVGGVNFARPILYSDNAQGFKDDITISLYEGGTMELSRLFPIIYYIDENGTITPEQDKKSAVIKNLKYYKKPNEILAINYQLCFLPYRASLNGAPEMILGDSFFTKNGLIKDIKDKKFKLFTSSYKYSENDTKGKGSAVALTSDKILFEVSHETLNKGTLTITQNITTTGSWAICDEDDNIYIAVNKPILNVFPRVYFMGTYKRF